MDILTAGTLLEDILGWHHARNLIDGSTDQAQFVKLMEEAGELAGNIARGRCIKDDIGDMIVVLVNIAARNNLPLEECMKAAWDDIKYRKGRMVDGIFIKEDDLVHIAYKDATHQNGIGEYFSKSPDSKFWIKYIDGSWRTISGDPGYLIKINKGDS
jgi:hypothetical protein